MGKRKDTCYDVRFEVGPFFVRTKYDTGSVVTVISAGSFIDKPTPEQKKRIKDFCENKSCDKALLKGASGHPFWGYLVKADTVRIGNSKFNDFYFYLVVENERDIALLGYDFIDKTKRVVEPCGNCMMSQFDEAAYSKVHQRKQAIDGAELFAFMDSLTDTI